MELLDVSNLCACNLELSLSVLTWLSFLETNRKQYMIFASENIESYF